MQFQLPVACDRVGDPVQDAGRAGARGRGIQPQPDDVSALLHQRMHDRERHHGAERAGRRAHAVAVELLLQHWADILMRRTLCIWIMAVVALATSAEVIDRIVVVVNRTPILASDCDEELRFEALVDGRAVDTTPKAMDAALERLIDQMLIEQQMSASKYAPAGDAETNAAVEQVRKQIAPDGQQWTAALRRYGLSESTVAEHV